MACTRLALLSLLVPAISLATPTLTFENKVVRIGGITTGGSVVCYAVLSEPQTFESRIVRHSQIVSDHDRDGSVAVSLASSIPFKSVWVVVDLATLQYAVSSPPGFQARQARFRELPFVQSLDGTVTAISAERIFLDVFFVRAGVGAWQLAAGDGGINDSDRSVNGRTTVLPSSLIPIGNSPAPPVAAAPGDFVALIDIDRLEYFAAQIIK